MKIVWKVKIYDNGGGEQDQNEIRRSVFCFWEQSERTNSKASSCSTAYTSANTICKIILPISALYVASKRVGRFTQKYYYTVVIMNLQ